MRQASLSPSLLLLLLLLLLLNCGWEGVVTAEPAAGPTWW